MADSRPRRSNAGINIGKIVNQELGGDDFYSTAYGGFLEESEDEEYETEASEDDKVDSDFDVDESGWGPDEGAEDKAQKEEKKKKKQWIKPYKQPAPSAESQSSAPTRPRKKTTLIVTSSLGPAHSTGGAREQRTLRKSTQEISRGFRKRREEEETRQRRRATRRPKQIRKLTQEELLKEAKWTEIENLASLEAYARMEAEKKKVKEKKVVWTGPVVRYLSLTMPVVAAENADSAETEGIGRGGEEKEPGGQSLAEGDRCKDIDPAVVAMETGTPDNNAESVSQESATTAPSKPHPPPEQKQARNFMVFTDTNNFPSAYFPPAPSRPLRPRRRFCPVTGLPAKYIDPLTRTPYATPFAFKVIRMRYVSEAEEKCEKRLKQLSNWLEEKKKKKMESI